MWQTEKVILMTESRRDADAFENDEKEIMN
jgi:hypothetical protein